MDTRIGEGERVGTVVVGQRVVVRRRKVDVACKADRSNSADVQSRYTYVGKLARELSLLAYQDDSRPRKGLCYTWNRLQEDLGEDPEITSLAAELQEKFQCAP